MANARPGGCCCGKNNNTGPLFQVRAVVAQRTIGGFHLMRSSGLLDGINIISEHPGPAETYIGGDVHGAPYDQVNDQLGNGYIDLLFNPFQRWATLTQVWDITIVGESSFSGNVACSFNPGHGFSISSTTGVWYNEADLNLAGALSWRWNSRNPTDNRDFYKWSRTHWSLDNTTDIGDFDGPPPSPIPVGFYLGTWSADLSDEIDVMAIAAEVNALVDSNPPSAIDWFFLQTWNFKDNQAFSLPADGGSIPDQSQYDGSTTSNLSEAFFGVSQAASVANWVSGLYAVEWSEVQFLRHCSWIITAYDLQDDGQRLNPRVLSAGIGVPGQTQNIPRPATTDIRGIAIPIIGNTNFITGTIYILTATPA